MRLTAFKSKIHRATVTDANLHYVIADLSRGIALMRGQDAARSRHDGAALVHGALLAYGKHFEDPDWARE